MTDRRNPTASYASRKLSASRASLMFGTALGVSIAIFAASPQQAWAADECGADVAGVATCTAAGNPYPAGITYTADAAEDITVVVQSGVNVITGTDNGVSATNNNGDATGTEIDLNAGATVTSADEGLYAVTFAGTGGAEVNNDGAVDAGIRGIFAYSAAGYTYISNTGSVTVDGSGSATPFAGGIVANGADSVIVSSGTVDVLGDAGDTLVAGIYGVADDTVDINASGAVTVYANAATSAGGIVADTSLTGTTASVTSGDVTIYNDGNGATAAISVDAGTAADVTVVGDLEAHSVGDVYGVIVNATTSASVDVTGTIYTDSDDITDNNYGISVSTAAVPAGTVDIDVVGDIITQDGHYAIGIYAGGGGAITIDVDGTVSVIQGGDGVSYGWGIYAINTGGSSIDINVDDVSVSQAGSALVGGGAGILAYTVGVTNITAGAVSTTGYYADGIEVGGNLGIGGDTTISVGSVSTTGMGSDGIDVGADNGFIDVTATGAITTTADNASGLELNSGDTITVDVQSVSTDGANSTGIFAYAYNGVDITATTIDTDGADADGVFAYTRNGDAIVSVANVDTDGASSYGIYAYSYFGDVDITATGTVDTAGAGSIGIYGNGQNTTIDAGTVITAGAGATGIYAYALDVADVTADSVTTTGDGAVGISAYGFDGVYVDSALVVTSGNSSTGIVAISPDSYVYVNSGTVNTTGDASDGIYAVSNGTDATDYVTVYSDVITTDGADSDGIDTYAAAGDITIGSGSIDTLGADSFGIYAYAFGGDIDVTSDSVTTAGINSTGIYAYSYFGYTSVDSGSVDTDGANSGGIYAYGFTGVYVGSDSVQTDGDGSIGIEARSNFGTVTVDSGTVDTLGDNSIGILAFGYGGTTVTSDAVTTDGALSEGIVALDAAGPVLVTSGSVETLGDSSTGIRAGSYYDVTVDSGTVETSGLSSVGINAYSLGGPALGDGSVTVTFDSVVTHGDAVFTGVVPSGNYNLYYYAVSSTGIIADAATGATSVVGGDVTTFGDGAEGIAASGFGSTYVNVDDVITYGDALVNYTYTGPGTPFTDYYRGAVGIDAFVSGGDVTVIADTVTTYGYEASGIVAVGAAYYDSVANTYSGNTLVSVNSVLTHGDYADGIVAANYGGNTSVFANSVTTYGDGADGIVAAAVGYYDSANVQTIYGETYVSAGFVTTHGDNAYGIYATSTAGDTTVNAYSVHTYGDGAVGIYAAAFNYYDSSTGAEQNLHGDVTVDASFVTTEGDFADAVRAYAEGGSIDISVFSVVTYGDFSDGISATAAYYGPDPVLLTYYSGDVNVSATSVFTFGDFSDGIDAYAGGGNVYVDAGNVVVYGVGSDAIYAGTGGLDVNNTDNVEVTTTGAIYSADGRGIAVNSSGSSTISVDSGSVYGYDWGIQSNSVDGTTIYNDGVISGGLGAAIDVDGGAADIYNYDTIYGHVDLTDNNDYLYNGGLWEAYGTSTFGLGADEVANEGVVGFSRYQGAASTTTFAGLENFNNFGVVTGVDGQVGDVLNISGNFFGGNNPLTPGTETSELDLDVQLGGPGSTADRLVIGSASGVTEIVPNDTLAASPGALNFGGILVVDSANPAEAGTEFTMANIDKGFVEYSLIFDAATDNWLIVGLPDDEVFELLGAMSSGQDLWKRSGDAISARWQELRDEGGSAGMSAGPGGVGRSDGWELWMQAHGGDESFDNVETFAISGFTFATDLTADSDWRGFQFGFDNLQGNMLWGLTMGFTQQETRFDFDNNSFDTEGWNIGGYFGWASNGFFLNGLLKGDFYEQDANFHTLPSIFTFDGVTWGAQGELGYRWEGDSWFFEPIAALSWNTTSLDSVTTSGATIDFDDATSFRGKAGARIGATWGSGDFVVTPYVGAYYVDEWEGDNTLTFTTGPTSITFNDQGRGSYGLADFGMTFQSFYGLEGFLKGEWNFGGGADGGAVRLGARWRW